MKSTRAVADPGVASRLQALRASDAEILERYPRR